MKIIKLILTILIIISTICGYTQITNVRADQKGNMIEIKFDLSEDISELYISYSQDGGKTFDDKTIKSIIGESQNLKAGIDKTISWKTLDDLDHLDCENLIFKVNGPAKGKITDQRDNRTYITIRIVDQVWMAENLSYKPVNGKFWIYNNDPTYLSKFGYLYDWETATKVCPVGWHLPSKKEFETLLNNLGSGGMAYNSLIEGGSSGFSAQFGGWRVNNQGYAHLVDGSFSALGDQTCFWSSTRDANPAYYMNIDSKSSNARMYSQFIGWGNSVRCLKD